MALVRVCLKCDARVADSDEPFGRCANVIAGAVCGAREWAVVETPSKEYKLAERDRQFLKSIRVLPEV